MSWPHEGEGPSPGRGRRPPRREPVDRTTRGIVDELRPLAGQVPPPVLAGAVRRHLQEMTRLIGWLRD